MLAIVVMPRPLEYLLKNERDEGLNEAEKSDRMKNIMNYLKIT